MNKDKKGGGSVGSIALILIISLVFLSGCSLGSKAILEQDNSNNDLSTEEFGEIVMNFKDKVNNEVDSTKKQIDSSNADPTDSENVKEFLEDFKKTINEVNTENNEETIQELFQDIIDNFNEDVDEMIEDELTSPQNTIEEDAMEEKFENQLDEALAKDEFDKLQDESAKELAKEIEEIITGDELKDQIQKAIEDLDAKETERQVLKDILDNMRRVILEDYNDMLNQEFAENANKKGDKKKEEKNFGCEDACQMYSDCAGYGEGVGEKGMKEAYDSCFQECPNWSSETLACMERTGKIKTPADCVFTTCALKEYY